MNRNLYIAEILESVDLIISDKANAAHKKNKFINKYKKFSNKNIYMSDNPETEKIIRDAEKSVKNKKKSTEEENLIDQNTRRAINLSQEENLELARKRAERNKDNILGGESYLEEDTLEEENYSSDLASEKPLILDNTLDTLVLNNEFVEEENNESSEHNLEELEEENNESSEHNLEELEEENNLKDLESNLVYINEKLKRENIKNEETIKDQTILIDKFLSQKRYSDIDKKIKLYQDDNSVLRKKIFQLSKIESNLRLEIANLSLNEQIKEQKNAKLEQSPKIEKQDIKGLNVKIEDLTQKINQMGTELLDLKINRESQSMGINQKIKFYREEYAKIIVDKRDIERKLENSKSQLAINENNKKELRVALDNLNKIVAASNIESSTFINKIEEQETNTNPIIDSDKTKEE